jgi:hypothetical protein
MQAQRERYWEEAEPADKIERLRDELARACKVITELSGLVVKLGAHQHGENGALLVPMLAEDRGNRVGLFAHDNGVPHRIRTKRERRD